MLAMALDVGVARITYGVVLPALARDLHRGCVTFVVCPRRRAMHRTVANALLI
jgi:hypothetical protein